MGWRDEVPVGSTLQGFEQFHPIRQRGFFKRCPLDVASTPLGSLEELPIPTEPMREDVTDLSVHAVGCPSNLLLGSHDISSCVGSLG